jgi:GNAT superfamily N-acetyltransferase
MKEVECQILPAESIEEAAELMADAFSNSSSFFRYIFKGNVASRQKALRWFFKRNLTMLHRRCPSVLRGALDDEGEIVAAFLLIPSSVQITTWQMVKAGMWQIPFRFGSSTLKRLLQVIEHCDRGEEEFFSPGSSNSSFSSENRDVMTLNRMAVRPANQGQGIGSRCLESVLSEHQHVSVRLLTQERKNVRFYERLGFTVVGESTFDEDNLATTYTKSTRTKNRVEHFSAITGTPPGTPMATANNEGYSYCTTCWFMTYENTPETIDDYYEVTVVVD